MNAGVSAGVSVVLVCKCVRATPHVHHNPNMTITETITMLHKEHEGLSVGVAETILTQKNQEQIIKTCM